MFVLLKGMGPIEFHNVELSQFSRMKQCSVWVHKISGTIATIDAISKTFKGGLKDLRFKQKSIFMFDLDFMDGQVNEFEDLDQSFQIRGTFKMHFH